MNNITQILAKYGLAPFHIFGVRGAMIETEQHDRIRACDTRLILDALARCLEPVTPETLGPCSVEMSEAINDARALLAEVLE